MTEQTGPSANPSRRLQTNQLRPLANPAAVYMTSKRLRQSNWQSLVDILRAVFLLCCFLFMNGGKGKSIGCGDDSKATATQQLAEFDGCFPPAIASVSNSVANPVSNPASLPKHLNQPSCP